MNSRMAGFERESLMAVLHSKRIWFVHVIANAGLMASFFYWTRIPDEHGWQFAMTVVVGVLIAFSILWLHSATFEFFAERGAFTTALKRTLAHVPWFLLWAAIFGAVLWLVGRGWSYDAQTGGWLRHLLPGFLRKSVNPRTTISLASAVIWFAFYVLWPILALPIGGQVASRGLLGFVSTSAFRPIAHLRFWIMYAACFLLGAYIPYKLAWMIPTEPSPLSSQEMSMAIRLGVGYLLLVTAWLVLCAAIVRASGGPAVKTALETEPAPEPSTTV
jgi:hypothetical protein